MYKVEGVFKKPLQIRNEKERQKLVHSKSAQIAASKFDIDEEAESAVHGIYNDSIGTVVATNKKVMFVSRMARKVNQIIMPYTDIIGVTYSSGWIFGKVLIKHGDNILVISKMPKKFAKSLARLIEKHIDPYKVTPFNELGA